MKKTKESTLKLVERRENTSVYTDGTGTYIVKSIFSEEGKTIEDIMIESILKKARKLNIPTSHEFKEYAERRLEEAKNEKKSENDKNEDK